ncbi:MAG: NUDIX domain-containing protein [Candidatus Heimdallarchaeota archaeon]|nr:NUDIX domain-containing protein [Candidatus Heimdallarchaeota archaeon]MBY8995127.1 NUDIX domain-containing protein [Candidatus Heimdallarchaeota archaeon]
MTEDHSDIGFFGGYRVAGVLVKDERVLLFTEGLIDFWVLPGGGVKIFESSEQAIKREFQEEIGVTIAVDRLLWVVENSFIMDEKKYHAIELTFLVSPLDSEEKLTQEEFIGYEKDLTLLEGRYKDVKDLKMTFRWFHPNELDSITIKPDIYHEALKNIPDHPTLIRNLEVKIE